MANVKFQNIPYRGSAPALTDLVGGSVDLMFDNLGVSLPLVKAGQHQNLECLSCHTVGLNDPEGFSQLHQLVEWSKDQEKPPATLEGWLSEIRSLGASETRTSLRRASRVHATVQCENCHGPGRDHPFGLEPLPKVVATQSCLKCHTPERAPEWYQGQGGEARLDESKLADKLKKMACPAGDEE